MATALMIVAGVLGLLVFMLFAAVVELYRDVRQLREVAGILDRPLDVDLGTVAGTKPSTYGLPTALDSETGAIVLFLSDRCGTCHALAAALDGNLPSGLWLVFEGRSPRSTHEFLASKNLMSAIPTGRLSIDPAGKIAERIGLRTTPVGFRVENGRIVAATTVPSMRYLSSILPNRVQLSRFVSTAGRERVPV